MDGSRTEWHDTLKRIASFFQERKAYLANLFLHTNGLESFIANMQEVNYQCLKDAVQNASGIDALDALSDMYIRLYVLGSCQLTCEWILGKREGTAEELAIVYEQTLPLPLQQYFTA